VLETQLCDKRTETISVAKKSTTRKRGNVAPRALRFFYPVLMECDLERWDTPESLESEAERYYDFGIRPISADDIPEHGHSENFTAAACVFAAGLREKEKENKMVQISATYLIAVDMQNDQGFLKANSKTMLEEMAKASAWPLFRDLFIHIGSQSGMELPLLPNNPNIRWLKPQKAENDPLEPKKKS